MKTILTRDQIARGVHVGLADELLAQLPEISRHNEPQISPQEYACGCVAITHITDRDLRRNEQPFEMRLAIICETEACEVKRITRENGFVRTLHGRRHVFTSAPPVPSANPAPPIQGLAADVLRTAVEHACRCDDVNDEGAEPAAVHCPLHDATKLTTIFIIPTTGDARTWADQYWDTYGFDFDTDRCRSGSVYAWSLHDDDDGLRKALAEDRIEFQTITVDFDEWLPIAPEDRTWRTP